MTVGGKRIGNFQALQDHAASLMSRVSNEMGLVNIRAASASAELRRGSQNVSTRLEDLNTYISSFLSISNAVGQFVGQVRSHLDTHAQHPGVPSSSSSAEMRQCEEAIASVQKDMLNVVRELGERFPEMGLRRNRGVDVDRPAHERLHNAAVDIQNFFRTNYGTSEKNDGFLKDHGIDPKLFWDFLENVGKSLDLHQWLTSRLVPNILDRSIFL
jgi:hypothetical protein